MQTSYIYSVSRVNTLSDFLLSKTDIERLLVAEPGEDLRQALKETYLAPYVSRVQNEDMAEALEATLIDAKDLVYRIAPKGKGGMLRILWIQYDIHNLRVFAKGSARQYTYEQCQPYLSHRGRYTPEKIHKKIETNELNELFPGWQQAYDESLNLIAEDKLDLIDGLFDELCFMTSQKIIDKYGDKFMKLYFSRLIDLHNLKGRLRHLHNPTVRFYPEFVSGGTLSRDLMETESDVLAAFGRFGGEAFWKEAIDDYLATGNSSRVDARSAEHLLYITKDASADMFSSASLVLYYLKCRQAAANIRSIVVGKESGLSEADIRSNLRLAYVNN